MDVEAQLPLGVKGETFQLDVAHVWGPRLYGISCTTGGDLARSAVVSLYPDAARDGLRRKVLEVWIGDQRAPEFFGISDVAGWQRGEVSSLQRWLRS